jgi:hypothetical protein
MALLKWDPRQVTLVAIGQQISGFAGDDMVELVPAEPNVTTTDIGPQGDGVMVASANRSYLATFTLMSGDPLNKVLYGLAESKATGPFLLQSLSDGRRAAGPVSYVEMVPSPKLSRGHNGQTWGIRIPQCTVT